MNFPEESRDAFYRGRFELIQPKGWGYRAGLDALLLAATLPAGTEARGVDLGAGAGALGLAAAVRCPALSLVLVERDGAMAAMARRSLALPVNAPLAGRLRVAEADILAPRIVREAAGLGEGAFDVALTNPPFHPAGGRSSPDARRDAALAMPAPDFLDRWIAVASALLRHGGLFAMIARPENLAAILRAAANRLGDLRVLPVHARDGGAATRLLVHARRGSRAPLRILPGIALRDAAGAPLALERLVGDGEAAIDLQST